MNVVLLKDILDFGADTAKRRLNGDIQLVLGTRNVGSGDERLAGGEVKHARLVLGAALAVFSRIGQLIGLHAIRLGPDFDGFLRRRRNLLARRRQPVLLERPRNRSELTFALTHEAADRPVRDDVCRTERRRIEIILHRHAANAVRRHRYDNRDVTVEYCGNARVDPRIRTAAWILRQNAVIRVRGTPRADGNGELGIVRQFGEAPVVSICESRREADNEIRVDACRL